MAERARTADPGSEEAPPGFAARVVARAQSRFQADARASAAVDFAWNRLIARFLMGALAALVLCAAAEWRDLRVTQALEPGVENTVAQLVWKL